MDGPQWRHLYCDHIRRIELEFPLGNLRISGFHKCERAIGRQRIEFEPALLVSLSLAAVRKRVLGCVAKIHRYPFERSAGFVFDAPLERVPDVERDIDLGWFVGRSRFHFKSQRCKLLGANRDLWSTQSRIQVFEPESTIFARSRLAEIITGHPHVRQFSAHNRVAFLIDNSAYDRTPVGARLNYQIERLFWVAGADGRRLYQIILL